MATNNSTVTTEVVHESEIEIGDVIVSANGSTVTVTAKNVTSLPAMVLRVTNARRSGRR